MNEFITKAKSQGLRVFLAESGTYGFLTNDDGTRVVSFHYGLGGLAFIGNYRTSDQGASWRYTTLQEHLDAYQASSRYEEIR